MNSNLTPLTLDLSDELIAELAFAAQAKGLTLEEWVTILVKEAISELPDDSTTQTSESQALEEAAKTLTALESEGDAPFNAEVFESEFTKAQAQRSDTLQG
ncbi:hypothetical protein [Polaromonas glacialis]|uniref:hypothetical protein n=1 Tax=Polaromonas glacialis TaxID=866564 RepID=UPI000495C69F|nr:hypothetical protein [Polaromonas glacialis]